MESGHDVSVYIRAERTSKLVHPLVKTVHTDFQDTLRRHLLFKSLLAGSFPLITPTNPEKLFREATQTYNHLANDLIFTNARLKHLQRITDELMQLTDQTGPQFGVVDLTKDTPFDCPLTWIPEFVPFDFQSFLGSHQTGQITATYDLLKTLSRPRQTVLSLYTPLDLPTTARKIKDKHPHFHLSTNISRVRLCLEYPIDQSPNPDAKLKVFDPFSHGEAVHPTTRQSISD